MVKKNNKTCICCFEKYTFCLNCSDYDHLPRWKALFHEENCKNIYDAVSMFGETPNEEIKEKLDKCDLSNKNNFHKEILQRINEVYSSVTSTLAEVKCEEIPEIKEDVIKATDTEQENKETENTECKIERKFKKERKEKDCE